MFVALQPARSVDLLRFALLLPPTPLFLFSILLPPPSRVAFPSIILRRVRVSLTLSTLRRFFSLCVFGEPTTTTAASFPRHFPALSFCSQRLQCIVLVVAVFASIFLGSLGIPFQPTERRFSPCPFSRQLPPFSAVVAVSSQTSCTSTSAHHPLQTPLTPQNLSSPFSLLCLLSMSI